MTDIDYDKSHLNMAMQSTLDRMKSYDMVQHFSLQPHEYLSNTSTNLVTKRVHQHDSEYKNNSGLRLPLWARNLLSQVNLILSTLSQSLKYLHTDFVVEHNYLKP